MTDHGAHRYELVADCPLRAATDLFAHTWDPVVLAALGAEPRRRRELRAAIGGISDKVLTEALRRLLAFGLVERHAHAEAPPRVEYGLTRLGRSLVEGPMTALGAWVVEHGDELLEAQEASEVTRRPPGSALPLALPPALPPRHSAGL
ncbi:winged helix-turn-helix transcriptional regulator [Streptomyces sp. CWNU-52B]|uniref:winged helix-turn-helix transcriptional regulator n=1 Tax=unclassified Streptomyces TaxID=2593676 RepID=UPI0039C1757F